MNSSNRVGQSNAIWEVQPLLGVAIVPLHHKVALPFIGRGGIWLMIMCLFYGLKGTYPNPTTGGEGTS